MNVLLSKANKYYLVIEHVEVSIHERKKVREEKKKNIVNLVPLCKVSLHALKVPYYSHVHIISMGIPS